MKLLDCLILASFTVLVPKVYTSEGFYKVETISFLNNTSILIKWKKYNELADQPSCTSLNIASNNTASKTFDLKNYSFHCAEYFGYDKFRCTREYNHTVNNLEQCTNYTITINCKSNIYIQDLAIKLQLLTPYNSPLKPVNNINIIHKTNLIQIKWSESTIHKLCIKEYQITLTSKNGYKYKKTSHNGFLLTDLEAGQKYSGKVTTVYNDRHEISYKLEEFSTDENLLRPVFIVSAKSEIPKTAYISWQKPNIDYNIQRYEISYYIMDANNQEQKTESVIIDKDETSQDISSLDPCKYYNITIRPEISCYGNDLYTTTDIFVIAEGTCMTETNDRVVLNKFSVVPESDREKQAKVFIPKELFLCYTENITYYSILVYSNNINFTENWQSSLVNVDKPPTWAKIESIISTRFIYQTTPYKWNPKTDTNGNFVFTIGDNEDCSKYDETSFCNGPLKPGRSYQVAVKACSVRGCVVSSAITFNTKKTTSNSTTLKAVLILAGLVFVAIVVLILRTVRIQGYDSMRSIILRSMPNDMSIQQLLTKNLKDMETEYNLLDVFLRSNPTKYAAMMPKNESKNRYNDVLPYDFNRVKLKSPNDYINASFIYDFDNVQKYIACQGPMTNTCVDMWQMVLEQNVVSIVMLCKLIENDKKKCDKYFPNVDEKLQFDDIIVQNNSKKVSENHSFTTNELTIIKGHIQKKVNHFQFHDWPDFGTPDEYSMLLDFCQKVNAVSSDSLIVVHCSAGVGRTGTYIACDLLLKLIIQRKKLNIFKTVLHLRKQRTNMVQTQEQYNFIYGFLRNFINPYL